MDNLDSKMNNGIKGKAGASVISHDEFIKLLAEIQKEKDDSKEDK